MQEVRLALAEDGDHGRGADEGDDDQAPRGEQLRKQAQQQGAKGAANVGPDQHAAGRGVAEAHVRDDLRYPLHDEVEGHDVAEIGGGQQQGDAHQVLGEELADARLGRRGHGRQRLHRGVAHAPQGGVDAGQGVLGALFA